MTVRSPVGARVLLTGCTGFVGKVVLEELMRRREELGIEQVTLLIRPRRRRSAAERFEHNVSASKCFSLLDPGWKRFCRPVAGDMLGRDLGMSGEEASLLCDELTHIIHCAASVKFDLPIAEAATINISGALNVLDFAKQCANLARMVSVSTAYVTPHPGNGPLVVEERLVNLPFDPEAVYATIMSKESDERDLLRQTGHPNTYTFTKCLAEGLLARRHGDVPLTLVRPSVVSASRLRPFPGWIDSHAAYAAFISLLGSGHLKVARIDPTAILDVVPCDDVAGRIITCAFEKSTGQPFVIRHAVAGLRNSGTLSKLARTHERHFKALPQEREARWAYLGQSRASFRFHEMVHHRAPIAAASVATRLKGQKRSIVRLRKLARGLGYLDGAFHYFCHHTFDFRTAFPPLEGFDLDRYLESVSEGISEHLLKRDPSQAPLRMRGTDIAWAMRQPHGNTTTRAFGYFVRKALRAGRAEISFNETEIKSAMRAVHRDDLVILAPSHRSYLDFLVTSLLCFAHPGLGLKLPRIAASDDFSRIPLIGPLLRAAGAFYIRRGLGAPDPELTEQIAALVNAGQSLEFYAEGTRSRSRRFLEPKRGMLRALQQTGKPAIVLPLSISYDRVAEEQGFLRELEHGEKHRGGLLPLLMWTQKLVRGEIRLGRIHVRAGAPLRIDRGTDIKALSTEIVAGLQRHAAVSSFHIRVFCQSHGMDYVALRSAILRRGGVIVESRLGGEENVPAMLARTYEAQWMHLFYADAIERVGDNAAVAAHIRRNGFWFPAAGQFDEDLADAVVKALFAPICRDYERVAREIEALPLDAEVTAHILVTRMDGAFLADVEDALANLAERGVLTRRKDAYSLIDEQRDLSAYRNECKWTGYRPRIPELVGEPDGIGKQS